MDWTIPAIILFGAMGVGLAMTPSIFREFVECVKEASGRKKMKRRYICKYCNVKTFNIEMCTNCREKYTILKRIKKILK